uniref:IST1 homolog n=1 Tax=Ornithodoros turicata TaxID=34597 RepID=A0A2R5LLZ8_9ACAR
MFSSGPNYGKLKTNLRLTVNRLKLLERKKTELAQKARKEIADYLASGKPERAKIRVEHIIREDYLVEAMELVEMYCDLLLARFGLVQQMKTLDEGLAEAVSSLIWVAPRLQADVAELKVVAEQLTLKYGKPYSQAARDNGLQSVNEKLIHKLSVQAPPKMLVEKYLIEIAKSHDVPYEGDPEVLRQEPEVAEDALIDFNNGLVRPTGFVVQTFGDGTYPPSAAPYPPSSSPYPLPISGSFPGATAPHPPQAPYTPPEKPPLPTVPPSDPFPAVNPHTIGFANDGPPAYNDLPNLPSVPQLPSVPAGSLPKSSKEDDIDFDDLTRRFEELKKRK